MAREIVDGSEYNREWESGSSKSASNNMLTTTMSESLRLWMRNTDRIANGKEFYYIHKAQYSQS